MLIFLLPSGCSGGGNTLLQSPTITIQGINTTEYKSIIPVTINVQTVRSVNVTLIVEYRDADAGGYGPATVVPGHVDPTSLPEISVPQTGVNIDFHWHAIADLPPGARHENVFLRASVIDPEGVVSRSEEGPFTVDHTAGALGSLPPYVPGGNLPDAECGMPYSAELTLIGGEEPVTWELHPPGSTLPAFFQFGSDGVITGEVPGNYGPAEISFVAMATDSNEIESRQSAGIFTFNVKCENGDQPCGPLPDIMTVYLPDAVELEAYMFELSAAGGYGQLYWSLESGELPLNYNLSTNGIIHGTTNAGYAGVYEFSVRACDSCPSGSRCTVADFVLNVLEDTSQDDCGSGPYIVTQDLPDIVEGQPYNVVVTVSHGYGEFTWTINDGALPDGLELSEEGIISGTPTDGTGGASGIVYTFEVQVCDSCPVGVRCDYQFMDLLVLPDGEPCLDPPGIVLNYLGHAVIGYEYSHQFTALGGDGQLIWVLNNPGDLPAGLNFSETGLLSGVPVAGTEGEYELDITVQDSCMHVPQTDNELFTLRVYVECAPPPEIVTTTVPVAVENDLYDFQFMASGGEGSLSWHDYSSNIWPDGINFENTGRLHGTPAEGTAGTYFDNRIEVYDQCTYSNQNDKIDIDFIVTLPTGCAPPPEINQSPIGVPAGYFVYHQLTASGGHGHLYWSVAEYVEPWPDTLTLSDSGLLAGTTEMSEFGEYNFTVEVCDECDTPEPQCHQLPFMIVLEESTGCDPPPEIQDTVIPTPTADGSEYSFTMSGTGGQGDLQWNGRGFPPDIYIHSVTGNITGELYDGQQGTYEIYIGVYDGCSPVVQADSAMYIWEIN